MWNLIMHWNLKFQVSFFVILLHSIFYFHIKNHEVFSTY